MYKLVDTFNDRLISRHKTILAAVKAELKHDRAVKRNNGQNSYIPTAIVDEHGNPVDRDSYHDAQDLALGY